MAGCREEMGSMKNKTYLTATVAFGGTIADAPVVGIAVVDAVWSSGRSTCCAGLVRQVSV